MLGQDFLHTSHKYVYNLIQLFRCHRVGRIEQTVVTLRSLQVCTTAKAVDYETIREAALLSQEAELFAFEVVLFRFV